MGVVMSDNTMQIWGDGSVYQMGIGPFTADAFQPTTVSFPDNTSGKVSEIFIGTALVYTLMDDGTVYGQGDNNGAYGSVGVGSVDGVIYLPTLVTFPISGVVVTKIVISAGTGTNKNFSSVYALDNVGRIWSWGYNGYGQLGDGSITSRTSPVRVKDPDGSDTVGFLDIIANPMGRYTTFWAIAPASPTASEDRRVMACGWSATNGVLCRGSLVNTAANLPNWVQDNATGNAHLTAVTKVVAAGSGLGYANVYFLTSGKIYSAGDNLYGQLGDGGTAYVSYAKEITALTSAGTVTDIAVSPGGGYYNTCIALLSDGTVRTWGYNGYGVLGDNTVVAKGTPFQPIDNASATFTDIDRIWCSGGDSYNTLYAKKNTGEILACGYNAHGECGRGNQDDTYTFHTMFGTRFGGVDDFSDMTVNSYGSSGSTVFLLRTDGSVWACGADTSGAEQGGVVFAGSEHYTFSKIHLIR
jgi:alpha-tubulin suppressor-like RCC1 family protein